MKQLLFLLLFPCLALAQYPGNAGQKITLGEQTTADGLVYRGLAADTTRKPSVDTMAYILLDTATNILWQYKKATSNAWLRVGGSISSGLTGTLPVANGGTNAGAFTAGSVVFAGSGGTYTQDNANLFWNDSDNRLGIGTTAPSERLHVSGNIYGAGYLLLDNTVGRLTFDQISGANRISSTTTGFAAYEDLQFRADNYIFSTGTTERLRITSGGNVGINSTASSDFVLDVYSKDNAYNTRLYQPSTATDTYISLLVSGAMTSAIGYFGAGGSTTSNPTFRDNVVVGSQSNHPLVLNTNDAERMRITAAGNVGIGTTSPSEKLHVAGNARITAMNGINDIGADANGVLQAATSDMNLKNTIEDSPFGLNEILLLNPVTFLYNDENRKIDSDVKEVGFIAQDVFDIIPNAVSSTGTGDLQLDYRAITATLVKAIQEQQALIKALEQRILILENK